MLSVAVTAAGYIAGLLFSDDVTWPCTVSLSADGLSVYLSVCVCVCGAWYP